MSVRLDGKVAVITGATSGIGARTAERFVAEGARVVLAGRRRELGEALAARLGKSARFVRTDVTVEGDVRALIHETLGAFGRLDCLFNNAGTIPSLAPLTELALDDFDAGLAVHVRSALAGLKHAAPAMIRQRSGSIINMGSVVGLQAGIGSIAYSTAKAAVLHLSRCAAIELGEHGVRVNSVSPGPIVTGIFGKRLGVDDATADAHAGSVLAAFAEILPQVQALPRPGTADDVASAAPFLASDESSFITGHDLVIDGGSQAGRPAPIYRTHGAAFAKAFEGR